MEALASVANVGSPGTAKGTVEQGFHVLVAERSSGHIGASSDAVRTERVHPESSSQEAKGRNLKPTPKAPPGKRGATRKQLALET